MPGNGNAIGRYRLVLAGCTNSKETVNQYASSKYLSYKITLKQILGIFYLLGLYYTLIALYEWKI